MGQFIELLGDLLVLALLPGFLAAKTRDLITDRERQGNLASDVVRAMIYWLPILLVMWVLSSTAMPSLNPLPIDGGFESRTFVTALVSAIPIGLLLGILSEQRWVQRIAYRLHITRKTWKSPWLNAFADASERDCWTVVWLKDGTRLQGAHKYVSDFGKDAVIHLAATKDVPVKIRHPGADYWADVPGIGVLLPPSAEISHIDFLTGQIASADQDTADCPSVGAT